VNLCRAFLFRFLLCGTVAILPTLGVTFAGHAVPRSEAAVLAAPDFDPDPAHPGSSLQRWVSEVDLRYYGSCELRGPTDGPRIAALSKFVDEINAIGADLTLALSVSDSDADDIRPRSSETFGVAVIVGGGVERLIQVLDMGQWGDGTEFVQPGVRGQGEQLIGTGRVSNIGTTAESGRILAGIVYVDPAIMGSKTELCLKAALLSSFGFSGRDMIPYPDSVLAFAQNSSTLSNLDRCLIATLYSPAFAGRTLTPELFRGQLADLVGKSQFCQ
jgi:hypothetical protein